MWTASALASELTAYAGTVWRVVEAQHRISTSRLGSSLAEQHQLEALAEAVKPPLPAAALGLHYLLASPFRYGHAQASRFRRARERPGIFYASEAEATAIAEAAYWRLRFFTRSPGFVPPATTAEHSSFSVNIEAPRALDLTKPPFDASQARWTDPQDYTACQDFAREARIADVQLIRTLSVRAPGGSCNVVVLDPAAFAARVPKPGKTWHLRFEEGQLVALAAFPSHQRFAFTAAGFGL
ncbi:MAG: RES family NAD+ phosphorylase [Novosphingobium sp.]